MNLKRRENISVNRRYVNRQRMLPLRFAENICSYSMLSIGTILCLFIDGVLIYDKNQLDKLSGRCLHYFCQELYINTNQIYINEIFKHTAVSTHSIMRLPATGFRG